MNKIVCILIVCLSLLINFAFSVENSIIPIVEQYENVENLAIDKFTSKQRTEIIDALANIDYKIRLVSYNMLFNVYDHNLAEENRWPARLPRIIELMENIQPDVITTQELYPQQVDEILEFMQEKYDFFEGQKDKDGESFGIFYLKDRFELISSEMHYPLAIIELKDLLTEKTFIVTNTHMPLSNIEKREANAHKIVDIIETFSQDKAVIFTGDLNTFPNRLELNLPFYDGDYIHRILSSHSLKNSHYLALLGHFGPLSSFTNKDPGISPFEGTGTPGVILDYIYVNDKINVLVHATETGTVNGCFPSDHMPVLIDFTL